MQQRRWLLDATKEVWEGFSRRFCELWHQHGARGDAYAAVLFGGGAEQVRRRLLAGSGEGTRARPAWDPPSSRQPTMAAAGWRCSQRKLFRS